MQARRLESPMLTSLKMKKLGRYAGVAKLLLKYGRSDVVRNIDLEEVFQDDDSAEGRHGAEGRDAKDDPAALARELEKLGPTFVKLGQLLSTRADLLPLPYIDALSKLQDDLEPVPTQDVIDVIEADLGARISKLFTSFDREPLASASLGQVHRAVMRDGRTVAVKVQRPHVRERVAEDLEMLADLARFVDEHSEVGKRWEFASIVAQFRDSLARELDYKQEARNLETLARHLQHLDRVVVPQPIADYTSSRVLTMEYVTGRKVTEVGALRRVELAGSELCEQLFRAYLEQILVHGFFHADPHPGNVFLTDDDRLALIDLGMVAHVSPKLRDQLLKLLVAIANGMGDEAAEVAWQIGEPLIDFDREGARREIAALVAWNEGLTVRDLQVGRVVLEITRLCGEHGLRVPPDLAMLGKALLNLDRVGHVLDPDFDPNASIRRNSAEIATRRVKEGLKPETFLASIVDARDFVKALPQRLNKILDAAANNELKLNVDAIDEDRLISGLQKIANRITLGLILASLVIGAALLMRVETSFRLLGYPGLAILLFLGAAIGASWLAVHILTTDGKNAKRH
jgi:ubiquinone biosynthesis protein